MNAAVVDAAADTVTAIGVRFRRAGRLYYFDSGGVPFQINEFAIVDTPRGAAAARVVVAATQVAERDLRGPLKPVERRATPNDLARMAAFRDQEAETKRIFQEKVEAFKLPIQPIKTEYSFDGGTLTLHFSSAEAKVDLNDLARDLATTFRTRVELRQVGPRERTRLLEGMGRCGCELCCATFLTELDTITLRMAKDQNLPLNPDKISGVCGRLLCCLQYEHEGYLDEKAAQEEARSGGGCAASGACESCGVHDLKDVLGQPAATDQRGIGPADGPEPEPIDSDEDSVRPRDR